MLLRLRVLLRLLETRLLLDVSSVSRKTVLLSPARGQSSSILHRLHFIVLSFTLLLLLLLFSCYCRCSSFCPSLFRPTDRSAFSHSLRSPHHLTIPISQSPTRPASAHLHHSTPGPRRTLSPLSIVSSLSPLTSNLEPLTLLLTPRPPSCCCSPSDQRGPQQPPMPAPTNGRVAHSPSGPSLSPNAPTTNNLFAKTQDATESVWIAIGTNFPHIHSCTSPSAHPVPPSRPRRRSHGRPRPRPWGL